MLLIVSVIKSETNWWFSHKHLKLCLIDIDLCWWSIVLVLYLTSMNNFIFYLPPYLKWYCKFGTLLCEKYYVLTLLSYMQAFVRICCVLKSYCCCFHVVASYSQQTQITMGQWQIFICHSCIYLYENFPRNTRPK